MGRLSWGASQYNSSDPSAPYGVDVPADSGVDWSSVGPASFATSLVNGGAISANGTYMAVVVSGGDIWVLSDSGTKWTNETTGLSESGAKWYDITCSSSRHYMAADVNGGDIWTSNDYGQTWTDQTGSGTQAWSGITSSASGQDLAATVGSGVVTAPVAMATERIALQTSLQRLHD